jgi:hypothetical protein
LNRILDLEAPKAISALKEMLPILKASPGLLSEVNSRFYQSARDDLLALTADCDDNRLSEQVSPALVLKIINGDIETAVHDINQFLKHVDFPVQQELASMEEFSVLLSKLAEQRRLVGDIIGAAVFQEAGFLIAPRKDRMEFMIDTFIRGRAYPRIKNYLTLGVRLGFLEQGDLRKLKKEAEAWRPRGIGDILAVPPSKENTQCPMMPIQE